MNRILVPLAALAIVAAPGIALANTAKAPAAKHVKHFKHAKVAKAAKTTTTTKVAADTKTK